MKLRKPKLSRNKKTDLKMVVSGRELAWITLAVVIAYAFYWIFVWPVFAKRDCNTFASDVSRRHQVPDSELYYYNENSYDFAYRQCLHKKGL
jgi:hypothetical protein